jgi:hypothetical protein
MRIVVGVNTLTSVDQAVYSNHCQFWLNLGRNHPNYEFILSNPRRMSIDHMRNMTAKVAVDNNADYLMFIDDDILIQLDALDRLINTNADIAAGWTIIRGYPFKNMSFEWVPDTNKTNLRNWDGLETTGIIEVDAVGFSCVLIKCELLKQIDPPYFVTGPFNTEDIYFCIKAREKFPDTRIVVDLDVKTSHCIGNEYIDPINRWPYKEYLEEICPDLLERKEPIQTIQLIEKKEDNPLTYENVLKESIFG